MSCFITVCIDLLALSCGWLRGNLLLWLLLLLLWLLLLLLLGIHLEGCLER